MGVTSQAEPAKPAQDTHNHAALLWFVVIVGIVALTSFTIFIARVSAQRYDYPLFLNWNLVLWLVGGVMLGLGALVVRDEANISMGAKAAVVAVASSLWLFAVWRNVKNTNVLFGLLISVIQLTFSFLAVGLFIFFNSGRGANHRHQDY
jgi:hypothetical protein